MNKQITFKDMAEVVKPLPEDWDPSNRLAGMEKALDTGTFWTGLVYKDERDTIHTRIDQLEERAGRYEGIGELFEMYK